MPKINNYWKAPVKKRHNRTYRRSLTKHNKRIRDKRILAFMAIWFISIAINAVASSSNSFNINGAVIVVEELNSPSGLYSDEAETASFVEQESGAVDTSVAVSLPVMIEIEKSNEIAIRAITKEFDFKWENYIVNLACCEGLLKTDTINDKGNYPVGSRDRGLYGINDYWHTEVLDECAKDLRCSTIWTMNHINNGKQHEFICDKRIRGVEDFYLRCLN